MYERYEMIKHKKEEIFQDELSATRRGQPMCYIRIDELQ